MRIKVSDVVKVVWELSEGFLTWEEVYKTYPLFAPGQTYEGLIKLFKVIKTIFNFILFFIIFKYFILFKRFYLKNQNKKFKFYFFIKNYHEAVY